MAERKELIEMQIIDLVEDVKGYPSSVIDGITPESKLADDLGLDSLDVIELVIEIEECYGISIPNEEVDELITIADVVEKVEQIKYQ